MSLQMQSLIRPWSLSHSVAYPTVKVAFAGMLIFFPETRKKIFKQSLSNGSGIAQCLYKPCPDNTKLGIKLGSQHVDYFSNSACTCLCGIFS